MAGSVSLGLSGAAGLDFGLAFSFFSLDFTCVFVGGGGSRGGWGRGVTRGVVRMGCEYEGV